jgi:hypothetical protein
MKYYITDDNFNVLSIHPDRESAKAVWDVNWKAGIDVYLENEENHLKNIEWAKDYKRRRLEREQRAISKALKEMDKEYKEIDMLVEKDLERKEIEKVTGDLWKDMSKDIIFEFDEDDVKPMSLEFEEAAQREAIEDMVKQDDLKLLNMLQDHIKNKKGDVLDNLWNEPTEGCDDCLWIIKETDGDVIVCDECLKERNNK